MNVKDIVLKYLKDNNYDGLFNSFGECGCTVEDLSPCDALNEVCEPGYKEKYDCKEDYHNYHIVPEKEN